MFTQPRPIMLTTAAVCLVWSNGCVSNKYVHQHDVDIHGVVFYLDGAGGGGAKDWGKSFERGLRDAGYNADFQGFRWQTGLGVGVDQTASVEFKRRKGAELAAIIRDYVDHHPGTPVHIAALSAGTAVAAFALEELPEDRAVDNVVFLGASLSSHYDMTEALKRVRGRVTVFTSEKDKVLGKLVPISGTADRRFCGACAAGLKGLHLPADASAASRALYAKVENVSWTPSFASAANYGGHTDAVNPRFVREYIAPVLLSAGPRFVATGQEPVQWRDLGEQPR